MVVLLLTLTPLMGATARSVAAEGDEGARGAAIAVIDFEYVDTSGEPADQAQAHQARLKAFMIGLKDDVAAQGRFRLVSPRCGPDPCSLAGSTLSDLLAAAREVGADILLIGGIHKMSTLVQWAKVEAIEVKTERIALAKLFTFRGDTDEAWRRAQAFIADQLTGLPHAP
jgi:hypothetical protein